MSLDPSGAGRGGSCTSGTSRAYAVSSRRFTGRQKGDGTVYLSFRASDAPVSAVHTRGIPVQATVDNAGGVHSFLGETVSLNISSPLTLVIVDVMFQQKLGEQPEKEGWRRRCGTRGAELCSTSASTTGSAATRRTCEMSSGTRGTSWVRAGTPSQAPTSASS
ncbi:unnamed protein product [Prorocentrum cordatum]|uniref:Uncharacterized protein n=1 Tax=Prorocentrum cordatum TaxID=2364126 RepID=A0ABN9R5U8_9DINO|nr:unnamed protein product [Polarella glacialis]